MNLYALSSLITALTSILLGFFVLFKNPKGKQNKLWFYTSISIFLWTFSLFWCFIANNIQIALLSQKVLYIGTTLIPIFFYNYCLVLTNFQNYYKYKIKFYIGSILASIFILLIPTNLLIKNILLKNEIGYWPIEFTFIYYFYLAYFSFFVIDSVIVLSKGIKIYSGNIKQQIKFVFYAALVGFIGGSFNFLLDFNFNYPVGNFFVSFYVIIVAYAIVKYRLMDISLIISRSILYFLLASTVTASFATITFIAGNLFQNLTKFGNIIVTGVASLLIVIFLDPLKRLLAQATDRVFYKGKIDYQNVLLKVGEIIAKEIDLTKLAKSIQTTLCTELKLKNLQIIQKSRDENFRNITNNHEVIFEKHTLLPKYLEGHNQIIITEELPRRISETKEEREKKEVKQVLDKLDQLKYSMVVPINIENNLTAIFLIGPKLSGGAYSQEDINFFNLLSPQIATALEKSRLYREIQEFNVHLQEKIDQATISLREVNVTLADKNRYLLALQRITSLITRSLDFNKVTQAIADGIATELGYSGGLLSFIDETGTKISPKAITQTPLVKRAIALLPKKPDQYFVKLTEADNLGVRAIKTGHWQKGEHFYDFVKPAIPQALAWAVQKAVGGKSVIAVPVYSENKVIGVIDYVINKELAEVTDDEIEMMHSLADQVGIVSRNLSLIEQIQRTNAILQEANERLKNLDKAKSEFLSIASHQLRTPLTAIRGYVAMGLDGDYGPVPAKLKNPLQIVLDSSARLARLINIFLNISRIEAGKFKLEMTEVDLGKVLENIIKELSKEAEAKKLQLQFVRPKQKIPLVKIDSDKIKDVIYNLIDNAIKYTLEGFIKVMIEKIDSQLKISFKDSGIGIETDEAKELFNKFVRGDGVARIQPDGSGLGLYIAKKIIEAHGGKIWVESEGKGKGSTFIFTLPL